MIQRKNMEERPTIAHACTPAKARAMRAEKKVYRPCGIEKEGEVVCFGQALVEGSSIGQAIPLSVVLSPFDPMMPLIFILICTMKLIVGRGVEG